ncbi:MAG: AAA family ATPase, partial [Bacteroidota bacterium]
DHLLFVIEDEGDFAGWELQHHGEGDQFVGDKHIHYHLPNTSREIPTPKFVNFSESLPTHLVKRTQLVEQLHNQIFKAGGDSRLVVHGIAGIGKTSLLRLYADHCKGDFQHLIWVECHGSIAKACLENGDLLAHLQLSFPNSMPEAERFSHIQKRLREQFANQTCLVVIDNVEAGHAQEMRQILLDTNFKLVFLSREPIQYFHSFVAKEMQPDESRSLFSFYLPEGCDEHQLQTLFSSVGYHPFAIEMISKHLQNGVYKSLDDVLKLMERRQGKPFTGSDLDDFFKKLVRVDKLPHDEQILLLHLSVIPPSTWSFDELAEILNLSPEKAAATRQLAFSLLAKGYLSGDMKHLQCHQIIQMAAREANRPTAGNCRELLDAFGKPL